MSALEPPRVAFASDIAAEDYEPWFVDGKRFGEVHWLRNEVSGDTILAAGLWRVEPVDFEFTFSGNETAHILKGDITIELEGGWSLDLGPGDIYSFRKGTRARWIVKEPSLKFFVVS